MTTNVAQQELRADLGVFFIVSQDLSGDHAHNLEVGGGCQGGRGRQGQGLLGAGGVAWRLAGRDARHGNGVHGLGGLLEGGLAQLHDTGDVQVQRMACCKALTQPFPIYHGPSWQAQGCRHCCTVISKQYMIQAEDPICCMITVLVLSSYGACLYQATKVFKGCSMGGLDRPL